jgi:hypothetical protein
VIEGGPNFNPAFALKQTSLHRAQSSPSSFIFLNLVITLTASDERGTGEERPMSRPDSRGRSGGGGGTEGGVGIVGVEAPEGSVSAGDGEGDDGMSTPRSRPGGGRGGSRTSISAGLISSPPFPLLSPCYFRLHKYVSAEKGRKKDAPILSYQSIRGRLRWGILCIGGELLFGELVQFFNKPFAGAREGELIHLPVRGLQ